MKNQTRFKVDEASYFLSMMKQTFNDDSNNFIYNFNAFLSAARSITFFMQKQYAHKDGFNNWYDKEKENMKKDSDLVFLKNSRNEVLKEKLIKTIMEFTLTPPLSGIVVGENPYEKFIFTVDKRAFQKNEEDIIEFSKTQLNKLAQLVNECERLFL